MGEITARKEWVESWNDAQSKIQDASALIELAEEAEEESMTGEIDREMSAISRMIEGLEFRRMLSDPDDSRDAILKIQAGAGGTEAQDWTQMLFRMYMRWAEHNGFSISLLDEQEGEVAGLK